MKVYTQNDPRVGERKKGLPIRYPAQDLRGAPFHPKIGGFTLRRLKGNPELIVVVPPAYNAEEIEVVRGDYNTRNDENRIEQPKREVESIKPSTDKS
jgi:hypothetical protein